MTSKTVELQNVSKEFSFGNKSILGSVIDVLYGRKKEKINVINGISFDAYKGENIGIIGKNGSGKSTLLRIIAGIYVPDSGSIKINGKLLYINGFQHGLSNKLTMRENIFLMGSIAGLKNSEIYFLFDEIVEFSGLKDYIDLKISKFSSGMVTRLSFATSFFCLRNQNPEILLLDEVLSAGGDAEFKEKAVEKMGEVISGGSTVLMVSHNLRDVEKYCNRVIWMEKGEIKEIGKVTEIIPKYQIWIKNI